VATTIPVRFRGRTRRDAAAFYLSQLARGLLAGEVGIVDGDASWALATSEFLVLKIDVKQRKRMNHVEIRIEWPRRPLIRIATPRSHPHG
jgi:amphi-Trp domain-containing protein